MTRYTLALLSCLLWQAAAEADDLLDIYRLAQQRDATLASARATYEAAQEKLPQGRALLLPVVSLGAATTWNRTNVEYRSATTFPQGQLDYNTAGATLTLTQPLYRPQNWALYEEGVLQSAAAQFQYAAAQQDLMLRVAQAYFDVLLAQDTATLAKAQKEAILEQLAQAKLNFQVGTATITDTHEAQARFDLANASEIVALNDLDIKRQALEKIIGQPPGPLAALGADLPLQMPQPADMDSWVAAARQGNLQIPVSRAAVDIAGQEVRRNRSAHYPTLDLVASHGRTSATSGNLGVGNDTTSTAIGIQLNLPLYQGGAIGSRQREAVANLDRARQDLEQVERQTTLAARTAYYGVTSGVAQVKALEQALRSSQVSLDSTRLGLQVGVRTNVDLLNAQQQLFGAKRDVSRARYGYLISRLQLKSAAGTLSEDDLVQVNRWLNAPR